MGGSGVIDNFLGVFTSYIDSGFGLLGGEVAFIATTLIVIDVTLAALFWSWGADDDIIARLVKKTLFVGVFAYIIGNWNNLARIVFESFAGLGLQASGTGLSIQDLMRPGRVAQTGLDAARPLLESISNLMGWIAFFENFIQIACLLFAWALVLLAFFILAIQLFITLIEFKLTTLAGFVLIPFGLFGKTAFMAERVLGNVISSGIKVLVLAVIIGIGSTLFSQFTAGFGGQPPTIDDAMAVVLAALSLLGLGIFGPGIANGIVSGGPQLGAGSAIGTGLVAGGAAMAAGVGATHAAWADHEPRRHARGTRDPIGRQPWRRLFHQSLRRRPHMSFFKRPATHYGKTPEPETPYQRAAQIWDDRIGSARVQARNWRLMAFGCLILSAGFAAALVWQSARGTIVPWVVQVDNLGQAQAVAPAQADYRPTDPQVAWHLARFIEQVRSIPADAIVVRQNRLRAYEFTTDRGAAALNDFARANDPFTRVGKQQVSIEVSSVIRASPDSFRVAWTERQYENGQLSTTQRWTAILTIVIQPPRDAERLRANPLGIYVNAINWSREMGQ